MNPNQIARSQLWRVDCWRVDFRVPRWQRPLPSFAVLGFVGLCAAISGFAPSVSQADEADAIAVDVKCRELLCDFAVTLRHADEGWDHYADAWEVLSEERELLAKRVLRHPHVKEQPFTRSLPNVALPVGTAQVIVRGHDKLHGYGGAELRVEIPGVGKKETQSGEKEAGATPTE